MGPPGGHTSRAIGSGGGGGGGAGLSAAADGGRRGRLAQGEVSRIPKTAKMANRTLPCLRLLPEWAATGRIRNPRHS